ncbi:MAG: hypothetical protein RL497_261 [Pseudomonadota bacterium]|jgi:hypothetical protein
MFPAVWQQLISQTRPSCLGFVANFNRRLIFLDTYPVLIHTPNNGGVLGKIYTQLNAADIARLDEFEGEIYQRISVQAHTEGGYISCQTYIPKPSYQILTTQDPWQGGLFSRLLLPIFLTRYAHFEPTNQCTHRLANLETSVEPRNLS